MRGLPPGSVLLLLLTLLTGSRVWAEDNKYELKIYDLSAIIQEQKNFPGFDIPSLRLAMPREEQGLARMMAPDFQALIAERLFPLDFQDPATSITESGGKLVVVQSAAVLEKISKYLKKLEAQLSPQLSLQGLEVAIPQERLLEWLGQVGRCQTDAKIAELLKKESGAQMVSAPQFTAHSGQTAHAMAGRSVTYRGRADVSGDYLYTFPISALDGVVFEGCPYLDFEQRTVALEMRYLRSGLPASFDKIKFESPLVMNATISNTRAISTPVKPVGRQGNEAAKTKTRTETQEIIQPGGKQSVELELPNIAVRRLQVDITLPLGKWYLTGVLNPLPNAVAGTNEDRITLFFVRCDLQRGTQAAEAPVAPQLPKGKNR